MTVNRSKARSSLLVSPLCMLGNFTFADFFFLINFLMKILSGISPVSNSLDPGQAQFFVGPDLGLGNQQMTTAGKEFVKFHSIGQNTFFQPEMAIFFLILHENTKSCYGAN